MNPTSGLVAVLRRNLAEALRKGDLEDAAALLQKLKVEEPIALETRGLELDYLIQKGALADARALADQLLSLFPSSPRVAYLAGRLDYRNKDYAAAVGHLEESLRLADAWRARRLLGQALTQLGRLEEAERHLLALAPEHPVVRKDLSWLYERKGDRARALAELEAYLAAHPDDVVAATRRRELLSRELAPEEAIEEVNGLLALAEAVPPELLPAYADALLTTGRGAEARAFFAPRLDALAPAAALKVGWTCHHRGAYDLALDLFLRAFPAGRASPKFLASLEADAARALRLPELIALYERLAPEDPPLYGRLRTLKKRLEMEDRRVR